MDLTLLRTFVAVVQQGHLTRAAERLHISQPTASNHIRALEQQFGLQLFSRTPRGLEPTVAGFRLAKSAARILESTVELIGLARELQGSSVGNLALGTLPEPLANRMPTLVSWLRTHHPLLSLSVDVGSSLSTRQGILNGELDAGLFVARELEGNMDGLVLKLLDYVVSGPLEWKERLANADWAELAAMPWIVSPGGTSNADLCDHFFRTRGLQLNVALEVSNDELMRSLITAGVGIGFVRCEVASTGEEERRFATAPMTTSPSKLLFGYSKARKADPLIQVLEGAIREIWSCGPSQPNRE